VGGGGGRGGGEVGARGEAAAGEPAIAFAFGDFRLLQQRQSASACSDEDELGRHGRGPAVIGVLDRHAPAPVLLAVEADNLAIVVNVKAGLIGQVFDKQVGQRAIVDVAAGNHAGGRER